MKTSDVIKKLASSLPFYSNSFSDNINVVSLTMTGTEVTVTTATDHGFTAGRGVCIVGAKVPITCTFTRTGTVGTIVTDSDHDATLLVPGNVEMTGAVEPEFNGSFKVTGVPNRRTITVEMPNSGPTAATGTPAVINASSIFNNYNGWYEITSTPTTTTFTYDLAVSDLPDAQGTISAHSNVRISGMASVEDLENAYTAQAPEDAWLFVVVGDTLASKDRNLLSDATSNIQRQQYFRQQIIQTVSLYAVFPTAELQISGRAARDTAEIEFLSICKSILFHKFPTDLSINFKNPLQFVSHGFDSYNGAYYVHAYNFEQVSDLYFEDTVGYSEDVAFRDISLDMQIQGGNESFTADIDLDEDPI